MVKQVETLPGDTVGRVLFRHFGRDDDSLEEAFWLLNPKLASRGSTYPAGLIVSLPDVPEPKTERVVTPWD
ncbi:tail protein X [Vibrio parahaemolyticus]